MAIPGIDLKIKSDDACDLRLVAESRAENVALVRQAVRGLAEVVDVDDDLLIDVNAAVSEACNNVVRHAYKGRPGLMEVYLCPAGSELQIVVRDEGEGIKPDPGAEQAGELQGVGLSLIQAVTERTEMAGGVGDGTEVSMVFRSDTPIDIPALQRESAAQLEIPLADVLLAITAGPLVAPVLGRIVSLIAARRGFSLEKVSEVQLLADAVAAHAPAGIVGRHVNVGIDANGDGRLSMRLGPLEADGASRVVSSSAVGGMPPVLESVAEIETATLEGEDYLVLGISSS